MLFFFLQVTQSPAQNIYTGLEVLKISNLLVLGITTGKKKQYKWQSNEAGGIFQLCWICHRDLVHYCLWPESSRNQPNHHRRFLQEVRSFQVPHSKVRLLLTVRLVFTGEPIIFIAWDFVLFLIAGCLCCTAQHTGCERKGSPSLSRPA